MASRSVRPWSRRPTASPGRIARSSKPRRSSRWHRAVPTASTARRAATRRDLCGSLTRRRCSSPTGAATTASTRCETSSTTRASRCRFSFRAAAKLFASMDGPGISTDSALTQSFVIDGKMRRTVIVVHGRPHLLSVREGDRALETVGRVASCGAQEPAERRHDPGRSHRGQRVVEMIRTAPERLEGDAVLIVRAARRGSPGCGQVSGGAQHTS